jgi:hypothetical protein
MTPTTYDETVRARAQVEHAIQEEEQRHIEEYGALRDRLAALNAQIAAADSGSCSVDDAATGQRVLTIRWSTDRRTKMRRTAEIERQIAAAIRDLQEGVPQMRSRYFGIKSYDQWPSQIVNCEYGRQPSHGWIWFRIGLRRPQDADALTIEDRQACIRYLRAVRSDPDGVLG